MNILFIVPTLHGGGAERVVSRLANALCPEHRVYIVITYPEGNQGILYEVDPRVTVRVITEHLPRQKHLRHLFVRVLRARFLTAPIQLYRLKKRWKIDVSVSFLATCNYQNALTRIPGERTVVSIRCMEHLVYPAGTLRGALARRWIRYAGRKADKVVAVSRKVAAEQSEVFGVPAEKVVSVYNPVDPDALLAEAALPTDDEAFERFRAAHGHLVLTCGRLTEQKAQWRLIRAMRGVRRADPSAGLVILGEGLLLEPLRRLAADCGLADHVYFAGFTAHPCRYMGKCDVFVLPSQFEGFSNALLEAMACGMPLVASDCDSGPRELLAPDTDFRLSARQTERHACGFLTPVGSPAFRGADLPEEPAETCLAEAISALLTDSRLRDAMRAAGLRRIRDFTTGKILSEWRSVLDVTKENV